MKFVIILKVDRNQLTGEVSSRFEWEVRELLKRDDQDTGSGLLERTGPTLARGVSVDNVTARAAAESAARTLAEEAIYIYDTADEPVL